MADTEQQIAILTLVVAQIASSYPGIVPPTDYTQIAPISPKTVICPWGSADTYSAGMATTHSSLNWVAVNPVEGTAPASPAWTQSQQTGLTIAQIAQVWNQASLNVINGTPQTNDVMNAAYALGLMPITPTLPLVV